MIHWLDTDMHGDDSVRDLINAGKVKHYKIGSNKNFEDAVREIMVLPDPQNHVVVPDTLGSLLETTRQDARLGTDATIDIFDKAKVKFLEGDKNFLNVYQLAQSVVMRRLKNLANRGFRIHAVCHEDEALDPATMTKKQSPSVNPAMIEPLINQSSDVVRLRMVPEDIMGQDGKLLVKAGTRVLYMRPSDEFRAKYNVPRDQSDAIPRYITDPTMEKVFATLDKKPTFLTIYGYSGAGKTTLALSEALIKESKAK